MSENFRLYSKTPYKKISPAAGKSKGKKNSGRFAAGFGENKRQKKLSHIFLGVKKITQTFIFYLFGKKHWY